MTEEIIAQIKTMCNRNGVEEPHIFTEFGSFTVGESGAVLYSILNQKKLSHTVAYLFFEYL